MRRRSFRYKRNTIPAKWICDGKFNSHEQLSPSAGGDRFHSLRENVDWLVRGSATKSRTTPVKCSTAVAWFKRFFRR
ncbi:MAG: hypothetical protein ACTS4Z_02790 [Candidatus Hodgkinia cicadicola]